MMEKIVELNDQVRFARGLSPAGDAFGVAWGVVHEMLTEWFSLSEAAAAAVASALLAE